MKLPDVSRGKPFYRLVAIFCLMMTAYAVFTKADRQLLWFATTVIWFYLAEFFKIGDI